ncbi:MAG TPA: hypothetical protein VNP20_01850 [Nocardioidaceae bacterium]|nr:hypothetical protein [Nocardioidaceae bacterium]
MTGKAATVTCPDWCITPACSGEHSCTYGAIPATNGRHTSIDTDGALYPVISVSLAQCDFTSDPLPTGVMLGVHGSVLGEAEADLTLDEARCLRDAIDDALAEVEEDNG